MHAACSSFASFAKQLVVSRVSQINWLFRKKGGLFREIRERTWLARLNSVRSQICELPLVVWFYADSPTACVGVVLVCRMLKTEYFTYVRCTAKRVNIHVRFMNVTT